MINHGVYALGFAEKTRRGKTIVDYGFEPLDGDWNAVNVLDSVDDGGIQATNASLNTGRPVESAEVPKTARLRGPAHQGLFDVNPFPRGALLVSQRACTIIETLERGRHQFFPISVIGGDKVLAEMFVLVVTARLDGHNHNLTRPELGSNRLFMPDKDKEWRIVFDPRKIAGHHIWHEKHRLGWFVSSELAAAFEAAEMEGYKLGTFMEVSDG